MNEQQSTKTRVYEQTRKLLSAGWTQKHLAVDEAGEPTNHLGDKAVGFCLVGALERAQVDTGQDYNPRYLQYVCEVIGQGKSLAHYNDDPSRTQEQVVALMDNVLTAVKTKAEEGRVEKEAEAVMKTILNPNQTAEQRKLSEILGEDK